MIRRIFSAVLALCLGMCFMAAPAAGSAQKRTANFFEYFDTIITIIGYTEDQATFDRAVDQAKDRFLELHRLFDAYHEYDGMANIYTLNRDAGKTPVKVAPELMELLLFAKEWQPKLHNTVNIALGSVLRLWHDARAASLEDGTAAFLPSMEALEAAAAHTNFDDVELNAEEGTVFFKDPEVKLDVGAVAKGYATEQVAQMLLQTDMPHFIVNAGGNVRTGLPPLDGRLRWGVSLQNPDAALDLRVQEQTLEVLYLSNASVVTSGDYQRFYLVDGVRYHHIIDTRTLMPAMENRAVTIVCENSALADILSTAVFILPYEEGRALVEELDGVEALWVRADGTVLMTDGLYRMSKSGGATAK